MSIANLTTWLIRENDMRKYFREQPLELPRDKTRVIQMLEASLSPENLTCDGEISGLDLRRKFEYLNGALTVARRAS
jgi:hypothetical protein